MKKRKRFQRSRNKRRERERATEGRSLPKKCVFRSDLIANKVGNERKKKMAKLYELKCRMQPLEAHTTLLFGSVKWYLERTFLKSDSREEKHFSVFSKLS